MTPEQIAELRALVASQPAYLKLDVTRGLEDALDEIERLRARNEERLSRPIMKAEECEVCGKSVMGSKPIEADELGKAMWKAFPDYEREMHHTLDQLYSAQAKVAAGLRVIEGFDTGDRLDPDGGEHRLRREFMAALEGYRPEAVYATGNGWYALGRVRDLIGQWRNEADADEIIVIGESPQPHALRAEGGMIVGRDHANELEAALEGPKS